MIYAHLGKMMSGSTQTQFRDVLFRHVFRHYSNRVNAAAFTSFDGKLIYTVIHTRQGVGK